MRIDRPIRPDSAIPLIVGVAMVALGVATLLFGFVKAGELRVADSAVVTTRPEARAGQIRDFYEIKFNMFVMLCAEEQCAEKVRVARAPYYENGTMWMVVNRKFLNQPIGLADYGVIPYPDDTWNAKNWLKSSE